MNEISTRGSNLPFARAAYDGFIFDCDGTLADSMPVHFQAWTHVIARKIGRTPVELTPELFRTECGGLPARVIVERWNAEFGYALPIDETVRDKAEAFLERVDEVRPIPEVVAMLRQLGPGGRVAIASSGLMRVIARIIEHLGLKVGPADEVQAVICTDQVAHGKPEPDLFLRAAELLGLAPGRCLVFEDADSGFEAARRAGMDCLDVRPFIKPAAESGSPRTFAS